MTEKIILAFSGNGRNDAIRGLMSEYISVLEALGPPIVHVTFEAGEVDYAIQQIASGSVAFAITWLGAGQDMSIVMPDGATRNVWEAFKVPLLKLHGDLPAYLSDRHADVPLTSYNLYHAEEFRDFRSQWIPAHTFSCVIPALPLEPKRPHALDQSTRLAGKLVFLKNGNSPARLQDMWKQRLSRRVTKLLLEAAEEFRPRFMAPGRVDIGDRAGDFLRKAGIDPHSSRTLHLLICAQLDDYFRRVKSELICRALLQYPVLVCGENWEHIDFTGSRATLLRGLDYARTQNIYDSQLGVIDMSPNLDTWPHDRAQRCAGNFALLLTNKQSWLSEFPSEFDTLTFEFSQESISRRIEDVLTHPEQYLGLARNFGEEFRATYPRDKFVEQIGMVAELAMLECASEKPTLQPYFGWPHG